MNIIKTLIEYDLFIFIVVYSIFNVSNVCNGNGDPYFDKYQPFIDEFGDTMMQYQMREKNNRLPLQFGTHTGVLYEMKDRKNSAKTFIDEMQALLKKESSVFGRKDGTFIYINFAFFKDDTAFNYQSSFKSREDVKNKDIRLIYDAGIRLSQDNGPNKNTIGEIVILEDNGWNIFTIMLVPAVTDIRRNIEYLVEMSKYCLKVAGMSDEEIENMHNQKTVMDSLGEKRVDAWCSKKGKYFSLIISKMPSYYAKNYIPVIILKAVDK